MGSSGRPQGSLVFLWLLTLAGLALRLVYLPQDDAWWDELVTATRAVLPLDQLWTSLKYQGPSSVSTDCSPPLHHIFIHFSLMFGKSDFFLKLPNALFGAATIPVMFFLARRLLGQRAAWYAAIFICLSFFHVAYSRDARWYSLFFLTATSTFSLLLAALEENRPRQWVGFALAATAMCYTSYTAAVYLAVLSLFFALRMLAPVPLPDGLGRKGAIKRFALCLLVILVLYSPWIMGQINTYFAFYAPDVVRPFSVSLIPLYLKYFIAPHFFHEPYVPFVGVVIAVSGILVLLVERRYSSLTALLLWTILPVVAAHKAKIAFDISPRYIISVLLFVACMSAATADGLGRLATAWLKQSAAIPAFVIGLAFTFWVCSFGVRFYPGSFFDSDISYKHFLSWLVANKYNTEFILFDKSRQHKTILEWYLPDSFKGVEAFGGNGYKRCMVMGGRDPAKPSPPGQTGILEYSFRRAGILNRSPLLIAPNGDGDFRYSDNFETLQAYSDASKVDNVSVGVSFKELSLYDLTKPGSITYTFVNPGPEPLKSLTVRVSLGLDRVPFIEPDCAFTLSLEDATGKDVPLLTANASSFSGSRRLELEARLSQREIPSGPVRLNLSLHNGERMGILSIHRIVFDFKATPGSGTALDAVSAYAGHIARNTALTPWIEDVHPVSPPGPYCFDLRSAEGRMQREQFLSRHAGSRPVYALHQGDGALGIEYYDPWLDSPFLALRPGVSLEARLPAAGPSAAYYLKGRMEFPVLKTGEVSQQLLFKTPSDSVVAVNPGSKGRFTLRPVFTDVGFSPKSIERHDGLKKLMEQDCLTCSGNQPCLLTYSFQSILPVESVRIVWYPRLHSDLEKKNSVKLLLSLDGSKPEEIGRYASSGSGIWDGPERRVNNIRLPRPANKVDIIVELSGDASQIWSSPDKQLVVEATLNCATAPRLFASSPVRLEVEGSPANDFAIFPVAAPIPFIDSVEFQH